MTKPTPVAIFGTKTVMLDFTTGMFGKTRKARIGGNGITVGDDVKKKERVTADQDLFDKHAFSKLNSIVNETKQFLTRHAVPVPSHLFRGGMYCIPATDQEAVDAGMIERRNRFFDEGFAEFEAQYVARVEENKIALGPLFRAEHYPDVATIRSYFRFDYRFWAIEVPDALDAAIKRRERQRADAELAEVAREAAVAYRTAFAQLISGCRERLQPGKDGKKKAIYESFTDELMTFLDTFHHRNLFDDAELATLVEQAKTVLSGATVEHFRNNETFRAHVLESFAGIEEAANQAVHKVTRQIRLDESAA